MKTFKDRSEREWQIDINVGSMRRIKDLAGIDLMKIEDGNVIKRLIEDPGLLCNVVFAAVKPQADAKGITDEQFAEAMGGNAIEQATVALLEDVASFIPHPRTRAAVERVVKTMWRVMDETAKLVEAQTTPEKLDLLVRNAVSQAASTLGSSSTNSPALSASIPLHSPSEA